MEGLFYFIDEATGTDSIFSVLIPYLQNPIQAEDGRFDRPYYRRTPSLCRLQSIHAKSAKLVGKIIDRWIAIPNG